MYIYIYIYICVGPSRVALIEGVLGHRRKGTPGIANVNYVLNVG